MKTIFKNSFGGLSKYVWLLALVMLINRSGTMVIAFLSVYLTNKLGFSVQDAGYIMVMFGCGSILGTYLGGKLTDKVGYFYVQFWSLMISGIIFLLMVQTHNYFLLCIFSFLLSLFGEAYRPANTASIADFSTPETLTRSLSLIRLAINLGWAIGPALGGFLASRNYEWLFYADGLTCIFAAVLVWLFLKNSKKKSVENQSVVEFERKDSAYRDKLYWAFIILVTLYAISFFQLFTVAPLFYKNVCMISEKQIGYLMGLNGLLVFVVEMFLIYRIQGKYHLFSIISFGVFLVVINYIIFLNTFDYFWLLVGVIFATFSEIFAMPFMSTFSIKRSKPHNRGEYSGMYAMTWSVAQISAPLIGTQTIALLGYDSLWYILGSFGLISSIGFMFLRKKFAH